jgi:hypothetical protein
MVERPYLQLLHAFASAQVRYAVAGGFAVVLHGIPRTTFDLDIVVDDADDNMQCLVAVLDQEGFRPRLPVPLHELADAKARQIWIEERNLIAFTLMHPIRTMEELDILLTTPFRWREIEDSLVWRRINGLQVPIIGRALLRQMKLATGREKDRADAELLGECDD